jgi:AraC family transcriptional regulator
MTIASHPLASGPGWRVADFVCDSGPGDRPFEEQHGDVSIAAVSEGTFQYRTTHGAAMLAPGALLLGNAGACFECGHEHAGGDRCLSFNFSAEYFESIVADIPGLRRAAFTLPKLPPQPALVPLIAAAEAARDHGDAVELEELALRIAGAVVTLTADTGRAGRTARRHDERRVTAALRHIEAQAHEQITLADLACAAAMSPYHFLRTFRHIVGMTPHQYVLRTRLHRAAVRLRRSSDAISAIAFEEGFDDLSTFNRRFRQIMGASPSRYRARRAG